MEPTEKQKSSKGTAVGVGVACSIVGAIIGAVGYHFWKKEERMQPQCHSYSGKVFNHGPCPICLSEMEELKVLPCGHQYHEGCMKQLSKVEAEPKCPVCRKLCSQ